MYPAGGQQGKTIASTVTGTNLTGAVSVRISGKGVTGNVLKVVNSRTVQISLSIAANAEVGARDVRLITPGGVSTRFRFLVGDLPEINEVEPNSDQHQPQILPSLPLVVNGQINESDRDFFRFPAKAGQNLVIRADARSLLPYIADAVPGWNDLCLTLYDPAGKQLMYVDDFRFDPDPLLQFKVPKDGHYTVEVRDVIYRGRGDFVYRLTIGAVPYLTQIYPLGARRRSPAQFELHGFNLPEPRVSRHIPPDAPAVSTLRVQHGGQSSNPVPFAAGDFSEVQENEPNDSLAQAQRIQVPVTINGRIQKPGDIDHFIFRAETNQQFSFEVLARRFDSPLDSILTLLSSTGAVLAENDDTVDPEFPLVTHHADSRIVYTIRTAGDYLLRLRDIQSQGGEEYAYRLSVGPAVPDFSLTFAPDNPRVGAGDTAVITVNASRKNGFTGDIDLAFRNLPSTCRLSETRIPAGQNQFRFTITAAPNMSPVILTPSLWGTGSVRNQNVTRQALPTESVMQAFAYTHLLRTDEFLLAVFEPPPFQLVTMVPSGRILPLPRNGEVQLAVKANRRDQVTGTIRVALEAPPTGIRATPITIPPDKDQGVLVVTTTAQPAVGFRQNLILSGTMRLGNQNVTLFAPAVSIQVTAPPQPKVASK